MSTETALIPKLGNLPDWQRRWGIRLSSVVFFAVLWEIVGRIVGNVLFAPLSEVIRVYLLLVAQGTMYQLLFKTLQEMVIAFVLMVVVGVPLGLVMGRSKVVEKLVEPWVSAFFVTSTSAMLPLMIILFGTNFTFRMAIVWFAGVWHIVINVYQGSKGVGQEYLDVGHSFGASRWLRFTRITLPATSPFLMSGLRMGMARALRGIILAESYILVHYGGYLQNIGRQSANTAYVLALILNLMFLAVVLRRSLEELEHRLFPWSNTGS